MQQLQMADKGKSIEGFAIIRLIGQGCMGRVYQVLKQSRSYALKEIAKSTLQNNDVESDFNREVSILKLLKDNPNIVQLAQHFHNQEFYYLVFEYCNNESLQKYIQSKGGNLSEDQAIYFFAQILNGFQAMHEKNIIHGDISIKNILIHNEMIVKISDFGCSKVLEERFTRTQRGTIGTIAPEIVNEEPYSYQADVFSIGSVVYFMIFGKYPFSGKTTKEYERNLKKNQLEFDPQIPISEELRKLLIRMLEKDQYKRITFTEIYQNPLIQHKNIFNPKIKPFHIASGLMDDDQINYNRSFYQKNLPVLRIEPEPIDSLVIFDESQQISKIIDAKPEELVLSDKGKEIIQSAFYTLQTVIYIWNTNLELEQLNFKNEKKKLLQKQLLKYAQTQLTFSKNLLLVDMNFLKTMDIALLLADHAYEQTQRSLNDLSALISKDQDRLGDEKGSQIIEQSDLQEYLVNYAYEMNVNISEVPTIRKTQMQILIHLGTIMKLQFEQQYDLNLEEDFLVKMNLNKDIIRLLNIYEIINNNKYKSHSCR
ncbi:hypothetical protein pb186bvf_019807 [Paramecium bursaria]